MRRINGKQTVDSWGHEPRRRNAYIEVYNLSSGQILKKVGLTKGTSGSVEIGLSSFSSGIYGCRLFANGSQADVKRLCVVH